MLKFYFFSIVIIFIIFIAVFIVREKKSKNAIYYKKAAINDDIFRELKYLEFSIFHGNSPFNNYAIHSEFTLLSIERLKNLRFIIENIIKNNVDGDILEAGNWRGGSMLYAKGILEAYGTKNKQIWMFDTFSGFPNNTKIKGDYEKNLIIGKFSELMKANSAEKVKELFEIYNLSKGVNIIQGLFQDTIPNTSLPTFSFLRLDADSYENTKFLLDNLYDKLNKNGYIEFDDYGGYKGCKDAVDEFRSNKNINNEIKIVKENPEKDQQYESIYWIK